MQSRDANRTGSLRRLDILVCDLVTEIRGYIIIVLYKYNPERTVAGSLPCETYLVIRRLQEASVT